MMIILYTETHSWPLPVNGERGQADLEFLAVAGKKHSRQRAGS